jgi:hypothetical protein
VGLFPSATEAHNAIRELLDAGVPCEQVSAIWRDETQVTDTADTRKAAGTRTEAAIGGLSEMLPNFGALAIPGLGPVIAAAPLAAAVGRATPGAGDEGLICALAQAGVSEEQARHAADAIRQRRALVTTHTEDQLVDRTRTILNRYGALASAQRRP